MRPKRILEQDAPVVCTRLISPVLIYEVLGTVSLGYFCPMKTQRQLCRLSLAREGYLLALSSVEFHIP